MWDPIQRVLAILLLPTLIVVLFVGFFVCLRSAGPMFIASPRCGRNGARFEMYKLRTMVDNAEEALASHLALDESARREWQQYGRLTSDPRIAGTVARLARKFSIDELPQLFNVAKGQMNLVGPRPLPPAILRGMSEDARHSRQRVLPGMTGLWQVSGRSDLSIAKMGRLDTFYVRRRTAGFDLHILSRTVSAVVSGRGAF